MKPSHYRISLLFIILAAFAWRIHNLDGQSLWRDEVDAIFFAVRPLNEAIAMFLQRGQNGPLYFLTLRPWFGFTGTSEFALRFPSVFAGTLSIPLLYQIARRLLPVLPSFRPPLLPSASLHTPLLAATFLATNPYQLWYSQEGKMYAIIVCLTLAATWCWLQGISKGGRQPWVAYLLLTTIAIYTHLLMILIIPLHMLWFIIAWPQSRRHWRGYGGALAGLTLPYLPMVWWQWDMLTTTEKMTLFNFTPFSEMLRALLLSYSRGFMPPGDFIWLTPVFFLGLTGLLMGWLEVSKQTDDALALLPGRRRFLLVVAWLVVPIFSIYALSLQQPIFTDRYIIWIAPAAMLLVALGVQVVLRNAAKLSRPFATFIVIYLIGFWLYAGWQQKVNDIKYDLRSGVRFITERRGADELLILQIPHMEWSFRYYSSDQGTRPFDESDARLAHWAEGLWTNNGFPDDQAQAEVDATMSTLTSDVQSVWVLYSEVEMWDERHLMSGWLDAHGIVTDQAAFHGTQVKRYQLQR